MARSRLEVVGHTGLTHMRQGLADLQVVGLEVVRPYWLSLLAAVHAMVGQVDEGLHTLDDALQTSQTNGWRVWEPELYRLKGDLVLAQSPDAHAHAETWFRHALDLASQQQAKSIELRAAMHLSRLWQQQGQRQEARELLAPIYGWFTEGFDTVDLQEAKVLLAGLA
jgi:predicted ATPase